MKVWNDPGGISLWLLLQSCRGSKVFGPRFLERSSCWSSRSFNGRWWCPTLVTLKRSPVNRNPRNEQCRWLTHGKESSAIWMLRPGRMLGMLCLIVQSSVGSCSLMAYLQPLRLWPSWMSSQTCSARSVWSGTFLLAKLPRLSWRGATHWPSIRSSWGNLALYFQVQSTRFTGSWTIFDSRELSPQNFRVS